MDQGNNWVRRFDSDAPSVMLESFDLPLPFSIEFDQSTGELYAFEQYDCLIALCPPPAFDVARIDPFSAIVPGWCSRPSWHGERRTRCQTSFRS